MREFPIPGYENDEESFEYCVKSKFEKLPVCPHHNGIQVPPSGGCDQEIAFCPMGFGVILPAY